MNTLSRVSLIRTLILSYQGPTLTNSFNLNYPPIKVLSANIVTLGVEALTQEFWGNKNIQSITDVSSGVRIHNYMTMKPLFLTCTYLTDDFGIDKVI